MQFQLSAQLRVLHVSCGYVASFTEVVLCGTARLSAFVDPSESSNNRERRGEREVAQRKNPM
jgi:hypothetical protein